MNLRTPLRMSLVALVIAALLAVPALALELETAQSVRSTQGVVTAAHPLAAAAGAEILAKGGNAVDAAIATAYALAVVEPHASNLGGEGYMVISLADGTEVAIDYRSRAPLHVNVHTPAETGWPPHGILTTLIPGMVKGTELALQKYGTMTLAEVLEPAIPGGGRLPHGRSAGQPDRRRLQSFLLEYPEAGKKVFLDNMLIPNPAPSSATLTWLMPCASSPSTAPTCSTSAKSPTPSSRPPKAGSTRRLAAYRAYERDVVRGTYRGYEIVTAPPIVSGVRVVETLNILELFDLAQYGHPNHPTAAHIMAEALKITQADYNAYVWDPNFYRVPVEGLTSKLYARERAALISLDEAKTYEAGDPYAISPAGEVAFTPVTVEESPSTTHVSVLDKDGNAVALTQTISSFWGSRIVVPGYGFLLSNHFRQFPGFEVDDPFRPDYAAPLKTTRTVLAPTILKKDGEVRLVIGSPGAARIPQTVVQTIVSIVDFGMDLETAIRTAKFHVSGLTLDLEGGWPAESAEALAALGHRVNTNYGELDLFFGGLNIIAVEDDGTMIGVGSFRRDGGASAPLVVEEAVVH